MGGAAASGHDDHGLHISSVAFNLQILGSLIGLTLLTYVTAGMDLGFLDTPIALLIAFTKTTLVIMYFMHVRWSSGYVKILAVTGFTFLLLLFGFTFADVVTRTQELPWGDYTWPGAGHRSGMIADVPEDIEARIEAYQESHSNHGESEHGHGAADDHKSDDHKSGHGQEKDAGASGHGKAKEHTPAGHDSHGAKDAHKKADDHHGSSHGH